MVEGLERIRFEGNGNDGGQVPHIIAGQPFGVFYGTQFARDSDGNFIIDPGTGFVWNGSGDEEDGTYGKEGRGLNGIIGDPNADFKMSFINTLSYKALTFGFQFDWREGGDIHSTSIQSFLGRGVTKDTENRERTHIIPGFYSDATGNLLLDTSGNPIPNTTQIDTNDLYFKSGAAPDTTFGQNSVDEASVYDGTVYRLRELSLRYDFSYELLDKTPFGKISFSLLGTNLWHHAPNVPKYTNFDPEVTSHGSSRMQGVEIAAAPTSRRFGFKLNLTF